MICNRPYNVEKDAISLILTVADVKQPNYGHGTLIGLSLRNFSKDLGKPSDWSAVVDKINRDELEILIKPAANVIYVVVICIYTYIYMLSYLINFEYFFNIYFHNVF